MDPQIEARLTAQDKKLDCLDQKMEEVLEMVSLGKHLAFFAKVLGWCAGVAVSVLELWRGLHK